MPAPIPSAILPTSITPAETALPVFIGYTEKQIKKRSGSGKLTKVESTAEYESIFGGPESCVVHMHLYQDNTLNGNVIVTQPLFRMHYAIKSYFDNDGGACFIMPVATYKNAAREKTAMFAQFQQAVADVGNEKSPTLVLVPDASLLIQHTLNDAPDVVKNSTTLYHELLNKLLAQCSTRKDRFAIIDVWHPFRESGNYRVQHINDFRQEISADDMSYGAAYFPWLQTTMTAFVNEKTNTSLIIHGGTGIPKGMILKSDEAGTDLSKSLFHINRNLYEAVKKAINATTVFMPPSAAVAAVYCKVDKTSGVWKAPANTPSQSIGNPTVIISDAEQDKLNVDPASGKSINAIRSFTGRGVLVWGARTLSGNSNEWRYISVRRFFIMVETSIRNTLDSFTFEPNEVHTWTIIKRLIENFLHLHWQQGALQGVKPEQAYFVKLGTGETMTMQDVTEGRLIAEIGMAVVRPAEFIIVRISTTMKR